MIVSAKPALSRQTGRNKIPTKPVEPFFLLRLQKEEGELV